MPDNCIVSGDWIEESSCQTILKETNMIVSELNIGQGMLRGSPFINLYIL